MIKEKFPEIPANQITQIAIKMIEARNNFAWRQNNLTVRHRKGVVTKGVSDILFYNKATGIFGAAEVKKIGDTLSPNQVDFLSRLSLAGGQALIATQVRHKVELIDFKEYLTK